MSFSFLTENLLLIFLLLLSVIPLSLVNSVSIDRSNEVLSGIFGQDEIPNFWLKNLICFYEDKARSYSKILKQPEESPQWLTEGVTYLLPKTEETAKPGQGNACWRCLRCDMRPRFH